MQYASRKLYILVIAFCLLSTASPALADEPPPGSIDSHADDDEITLKAWANSGASDENPGSINSISKPKTVRTYLPACPDNWPGRGSVVLCLTASLMCAGTPRTQRHRVLGVQRAGWGHDA